MKILALIPARMGSSRFPGKPMAKICGKPMIGHVYQKVIECSLVTETAVATCDQIIYDYIRSMEGTAVMTSASHERASDRCAEALLTIEKEKGYQFDLVVMIQGDEPMVHPDMIREAIEPLLENPAILVTNLLGKIRDEKEFQDRNCIKVVCDLQKNAMYFSREPIPSSIRDKGVFLGKQICVIPFRRDFLLKYTKLTPTPLEIAESVDMLRILEHGKKVRMVPTRHTCHSVDTIDDLKKVEHLIKMSAQKF
jgi:3-deoxy-manno-octulosonate cytidylyltransferase (CMP-KDO synthetase)